MSPLARADGSRARRPTSAPGPQVRPQLLARRQPDRLPRLPARGINHDDEVWVIDRDGRRARNLTRDHGNDSVARVSPEWQEPPRSRRPARVYSQLLQMASDGSNPKRLSSSPAEYPSWSPDGSRVVFSLVTAATRTTEDPAHAAGDSPRRMRSSPPSPPDVAQVEVGKHVVRAVAGVQQEHFSVRQHDLSDVGAIAEIDLDGRAWADRSAGSRGSTRGRTITSAPASTHRAAKKVCDSRRGDTVRLTRGRLEHGPRQPARR